MSKCKDLFFVWFFKIFDFTNRVLNVPFFFKIHHHFISYSIHKDLICITNANVTRLNLFFCDFDLIVNLLSFTFSFFQLFINFKWKRIGNRCRSWFWMCWDWKIMRLSKVSVWFVMMRGQCLNLSKLYILVDVYHLGWSD